jgi:hypothetical protein
MFRFRDQGPCLNRKSFFSSQRRVGLALSARPETLVRFSGSPSFGIPHRDHHRKNNGVDIISAVFSIDE